MAKRSPLAQKLIDDLRLRKQQLGLSQESHGHGHGMRQKYDASSSSRWSSRTSAAQVTNTTTTTRQDKRSSVSADYTRKAATTPRHGHQRASPSDVSSNEIVPFQQARESGNAIDLSMAIALAFSKPGARFSMELPGGDGRGRGGGVILQRGIVDFRDKQGRVVSNEKWILSSQLPYLSDLHVGEIAKVAQNINLILHACSDGNIYGSNSSEVGKKLLKGAKDLEESLRMLINLQEASHYMTKPKKKQIKLLEAEEEEDESGHHRKEDRNTRQSALEIFSRFSCVNTKEAVNMRDAQKKPNRTAPALKHKFTDPSNARNPPAAYSKPILHQRSASYDLSSKPDVPATGARQNSGTYSGEVSRFSKPKPAVPNLSVRATQSTRDLHQGGPQKITADKVRIPNVIAKLMGLDELPSAQTEPKITASPSLKKDTTRQTKDNALKVNVERHKENENFKSAAIISSSEDRHRGRYQENTSIAPQAPNGLLYRANDIKNLVKKVNYIPLLEESDRSHLKTQKHSIDREINNETLLRKISSEKGERKNQNEREENMTRNNQETLPVYASKKFHEKFHQVVDFRNKMEGLPGTSKSVLLKYQMAAISTSKQSYPVNAILKEVGKGMRPDFAQGSQNPKRLSSQTTGSGSRPAKKSSFPVIQLKKPGHNPVSREIPPSKHVNSPTKNNSMSTLDKKLCREFEIKNRNADAKKFVKNSHPESVNRAKREQIATNVEQRGRKNKLVPQLVKDISTQVKMEIKENEDKDKPERPKDKSVETTLRERDERLDEHQPSILREVTQRAEGYSQSCNRVPESPTISLEDGIQQGTDDSSYVAVGIDHYDCESLLTVEEPDAVTEARVFCLERGEETANNGTDSSQDSMMIHKEGLEKCLKESGDSSAEGTTYNEQCKNKESTMQGNQVILDSNFDMKRTDHDDLNMKLTDHEKQLKEIILRSPKFANAAQDMFQIDIPGGQIEESDMSCLDETNKLILDCGYEIMQRKGKIEETKLQIPLKRSVCRKQVKSLDRFIRELACDLKSLSFQKRTNINETNAAEHLFKMLETEIGDKRPDTNCMWDFGWNSSAFTISEVGEFVKDMEKCIYNELVNEIVVEIF